MSVETKLLDVFCDNFVSYYIYHSQHINVTGRTFVSDHEILGELYEDAQEHIDTIGEILRTVQIKVPSKLSDIIDGASIQEVDSEYYSGSEMIAVALDTTLSLIECYRELIKECGQETDWAHISNFAQDRVTKHEKFAWKLRSILD